MPYITSPIGGSLRAILVRSTLHPIKTLNLVEKQDIINDARGRKANSKVAENGPLSGPVTCLPLED